MKIIILANKDIASNFALNRLMPLLAEHDLNVFLSSKVGGNLAKPEQLKRLSFFEQDLCNQLIFPLLNKTTNVKNYKSFEQLSGCLTQPVELLNNINSVEGLAKIKSLQPDLIISIRFGQILKEAVLQIPSLGVLNLHSGLLPKYRGVMATFWAMLKNEKTIGTTLHYIGDSKIDTGNIIAQSEFTAVQDKSYLWHVLQLYVAGCQLISDAITTIEKDQTIESYPQSNNGQYFTFPTQSDLDKFHQLGFNLFDENEIIDFIQSNYY